MVWGRGNGSIETRVSPNVGVIIGRAAALKGVAHASFTDTPRKEAVRRRFSLYRSMLSFGWSCSLCAFKRGDATHFTMWYYSRYLRRLCIAEKF